MIWVFLDILFALLMFLAASFVGAEIIYFIMEGNLMERTEKKETFTPSREEIRAINHYWAQAMKNAKGAPNREQRRKNHARG